MSLVVILSNRGQLCLLEAITHHNLVAAADAVDLFRRKLLGFALDADGCVVELD